jgi:filamentous hemagglutinin family protein
MSVNDSVGFTFDVYFNANTSTNIAYTIELNTPTTITGFVENYGDKSLKIVNTNFGIRVKNYKVGDKISVVYIGTEWIISGTVLNVDNVIMRQNAFSYVNGAD